MNIQKVIKKARKLFGVKGVIYKMSFNRYTKLSRVKAFVFVYNVLK